MIKDDRLATRFAVYLTMTYLKLDLSAIAPSVFLVLVFCVFGLLPATLRFRNVSLVYAVVIKQNLERHFLVHSGAKRTHFFK